MLEREPQPLRGQVAAVADQRALQVEAAERRLPGVQVGEPGPDVVAGVPTVAAGLGQLGAHLPPEQRVRRRARSRDPHPAQPVRGVVELAAARRPAGPPAAASDSASRRAPCACRASASASTRSSSAGARPPAAISATTATAVGAQRRQPGWPGRGTGGPPGGPPPGPWPGRRAAGSRPGSARTRPGRCRSRREPYAAAAASSAASASRDTPGGRQHLGAVLLDRGAVRRPRAERARRGRRPSSCSAPTRSPRSSST